MISRIGLLSLRSLVLVAVGSFLVLFAAQDVNAAGTFNPRATTCLDDFTTPTSCDGDTTAGAISDVFSTFEIDSGDYNFGGNVGFIPTAIVAQIDPNTPIGAVAAKLNARATIGLLGNPCNNSVDVEFILMNGSTNIADEIAPKPPDQSNVLEPLALDANNNGIPDGADKYPSYLNNLFDPDLDSGLDGIYRTGDDINGPLPPLTPVLRIVGFTKVPGADDWIVLNFVLFAPGANLRDLPSFDASYGHPSAVVLQDPSAPAAQSAISDFCSPLRSMVSTFGVSRDNPCTPAPAADPLCPQRPTIFANEAPALDPDGCDSDTDESNCVIRKNPANGEYEFRTFTKSQRDADGDGIENGLDTCALDATPDWDPRANDALWDPDGDGLVGKADGTGPGCDPAPTSQSPGTPQQCPDGLTGPDYDQDCFSDRQDNCPLIAASQVDGDSDGIGDACDPNPTTEDTEGVPIEKWLISCLTIPGSPVSQDGPCPGGGPTGGPTPTPTPTPGDGTPTPTPTPPPSEQKDEEVEAGGTVTTDEEGDGATASDPLETTVTSPNPGTISIDEVDISGTPPQGFQFLGQQQVKISAPAATADNPLVFAFQVDSSIIPSGENENTIQIFKDGVQVPKCSGTAGTASPDPCVSDRTLLADGDVKISVLSSTGGTWTFGTAVTASDGGGGGAAGGAETGVGSLAPAVSSIPAWAAIASGLGGAGLLGSLGAFASRVLRRRRQ